MKSFVIFGGQMQDGYSAFVFVVLDSFKRDFQKERQRQIHVGSRGIFYHSALRGEEGAASRTLLVIVKCVTTTDWVQVSAVLCLLADYLNSVTNVKTPSPSLFPLLADNNLVCRGAAAGEASLQLHRPHRDGHPVRPQQETHPLGDLPVSTGWDFVNKLS